MISFHSEDQNRGRTIKLPCGYCDFHIGVKKDFHYAEKERKNFNEEKQQKWWKICKSGKLKYKSMYGSLIYEKI